MVSIKPEIGEFGDLSHGPDFPSNCCLQIIDGAEVD